MIPLGILATAGASSGGGIGIPAYDLITSTAGAGTGSISFTSIPSDYKHLEVRYQIRENSNPVNPLFMRLNSTSSSSYSWQKLFANGSSNFPSNTVSASGSSSATSISIGFDGGIGQFDMASGMIVIPNYSSSLVAKTVECLSGKAGADRSTATIYINSGGFNSTSAINALEIFTTSGTFGSRSSFALYGIRG